MKKILMITTGGTIAMEYDSKLNGVKPKLDGKTLLSFIPEPELLSGIELYDYANKPSPHLIIEDLLNVSKLIKENIGKYEGFIITQGTDVLEEAAFFYDIVIPEEVKLVLTASMRSSNELGVDGPRNIVASIKTILSEESKGYGTLVVINDEIHDPLTVTKTYTSNVSTFNSPGFGLLGIVDEDKVYFGRKKNHSLFIETDNYEKNIFLYKTFLGDDGVALEFLLKSKPELKGIVIEGYGRGNVPPSLIDKIEKFIKKGIVVIITTRCHLGRTLGVYGYKGGGKYLENMGVILSGDVKPHKALILLGVLLGAGYDLNKIKETFSMF